MFRTFVVLTVSPGRGTGCVVVTGNLAVDDYWLPAGVYLDHWRLREGIPAPPSAQLLALPGTVDLTDKLAEGGWLARQVSL